MNNQLDITNDIFVPNEIFDLILCYLDRGSLISFKFVNRRFRSLVGSINVKNALFCSVREGFVGIFAEFFRDIVVHRKMHQQVYETAVSNGQLVFLQFALSPDNGIVLDLKYRASLNNLASEGGHLDVLKY